MSLTPLASCLYTDLFGDPEVAALFSASAEVAAMVKVEIALAQAQGTVGVIPHAAAEAIEDGLREIEIDPAVLSMGTASAGVPVPALVAALRETLGRPGADYLHFGATSQDIVDTGAMVRIARALVVLERRAADLTETLCRLAKIHRATLMAGRTRGQVSTPISLGLRIANWALPLARARKTMAELRTHLPVLLGGASGDLSVMSDDATAVRAAFAERLDLAPALPWTADREPIRRIGRALSDLTAVLGKIGADVALMARSEAGELRLSNAGGSSTMPQKQNPVRAEALMALAPFVAGLAGQLEGSAVHLEERDGARWMMEWLLMPQLVVASGAALLTADQLVEGLLPQIDALHTNAIGETGLALAEQLSFALVPHVGRSDAQALVKRAAAQTRENGTPLVEALKALTDAPVNWEQLSDITAANRAAASACDLILAEIDTLTTPISISAAP